MLGLTFMLVWFFGMIIFVVVRVLILIFTGIEYLFKGIRFLYLSAFRSKDISNSVETTQVD